MIARTLGVLARGLLLSTALTQSAWPITPDQRDAVMGKIKPVWQWNALSLALPADGSVTDTTPSLGGLVLDATGQLTYAPNNLITYSNTFTNTGIWNNIGIAVTGGADTGPDGVVGSATLITDTTYSGLHRLANVTSVPGGVTYLNKVSVKPGTGRYITIANMVGDATGSATATFDLTNGSVTQSGSYGSGVTLISAGARQNGAYWDVYVVAKMTNIAPYIQIAASNAATFTPDGNGRNTYTGSAGSPLSYYVWGATSSVVTYETTPRPGDQVITTGSAYYGPKFDYGSGLRSWEQRQNVIRNNTMQGAVAGVARTTGTISSISRSGSTTVVVAATGHNVAVGDMITVSGATPSAYNGAYAVSAVNAGVSYSYVVASSATDTASGATVAVVSPGTWPTNWFVIGTQNGINAIIAGSGVDGGLPYIDVRFVGKSTADQTPNLNYFDSGYTPAVAEQVWTESVYAKLVAGSLSGLSGYPGLAYTIYDSGNANLSTLFGAARNIGSGSLISQRISDTFTIINSGGTTASIRPKILFGVANGTSVDFTIRTAAPQSEFAAYASPPILTYGSAVTASAEALTVNAPLSTALAAGPWAYSWTSGQTGVTSCVTGAAGAFTWPQNGSLRSLAVYRAGLKARCIN